MVPDPAAAITDEIIMSEIDAGSRAIDLGCGDGRLLARLRDDLGCSVVGVELNEVKFLAAMDRGVAVLNQDLDRNLVDIPDDTFDWAILSQTLQQVRHPKELLENMLRISQRAIVVVPNFANWKVRMQIFRSGRAPVTDALPYEWYNTPNLHFMSLYDFRDLVDSLGFRVAREKPIIRGRAVERAWLANLRADSGFYVIERGPKSRAAAPATGEKPRE